MNVSRSLLLLIILPLLCLNVTAQNTIRGVVLDSDSNEPVPFATVRINGSGSGTLADANGAFHLTLGEANPTLKIKAMGFNEITLSYSQLKRNKGKVYLDPIGVSISEVIVKPRKEKYSKKNNPAVDLMHKIANGGDKTDPRRNDYYNFDRYEQFSVGINKFRPDSAKNILLKHFSYIKDYIDTSEITGQPILNLSLREKFSHHHYRHSQEKEKEVITALKQDGVDDFMDQDNMRALIDDIFRDIDLYDNDINILQNRFVSPLSPLAPDFYKFYITDTLAIDSARCVELSFVPRNPLSFGFTGKIYADLSDSTFFVRRAEMNVPRDINLNFIERLFIIQEFNRAPDGSRLKTVDNMAAEIKMLPGTPELYAQKITRFGAHDFNRPTDADKLFSELGKYSVADSAETRDNNYWQGVRYEPLGEGVGKTANLVERLRQNKFYYYAEKVLKIAVTGYVSTAKKSKFDIGPMNTIFSHNTIEGYRYRVGGITTANLNPHLFARGYVAYGNHDHKTKYLAELEYSLNEKKYHAREFPIHSLRASYKYDVDMLGQHLAFANNDNMFLSLKRQKDYQISYLRKAGIEYTLELANNFSVNAGIFNSIQESTPYMTFINGNGENFRRYKETSINIQLRFAPGEKFYQTKTHRYSINKDAPIITLSHIYAPRKMFGNTFEVNRTELSFQKRFWFSAFGFLDMIVKGGHVWSRSSYPDLLIPNANLSYTIQPETFSLMNAMEFINDSYASWDITYWANGAILNYIPLIKKLKLREAFSFRGLWGHLSHRNNPDMNPELYSFPAISDTRRLTNRPYMEASVGLDNIFKILRVDYVWRLTYRDLPGIDRHGVRVELHFTF